MRAAGRIVSRSMGTVGDAYDNALCESFFATLECELLDRVALADRRHAQRELFPYIKGWYNTHRRHSALDELSPLEFETLHNNNLKTPNTSLSTVRG